MIVVVAVAVPAVVIALLLSLCCDHPLLFMQQDVQRDPAPDDGNDVTSIQSLSPGDAT